MRRARWLAPWKDSLEKPSIYHCISRVVERRFALGEAEREQFRKLMRMYESFSGCRVLSYCVMSNHFHLLLEVPPMPTEGIGDDELLRRLSAINGKQLVAEVSAELAAARAAGDEARAVAVHARFSYRMHDLSQFMKGLLQRFTRWFNRRHGRSGTLWEERYKSVIVESGTAARTMAAYIDLNPLRAGMVDDPADYRWSSYGEAMGGGRKSNGKKARIGLVRAWCAGHSNPNHEFRREAEAGAMDWREVSVAYRALLGMAVERKGADSGLDQAAGRNWRSMDGLPQAGGSGAALKVSGLSEMLRRRVRYFTDGAVIGSREFVNEAFVRSRGRFGPRRKDGARKMRGAGADAAGILWSMRDLRLRI